MKSSSDFTANSQKTVEQLRTELERTRLEIELLKVKLENAKLHNKRNRVNITVNFDSDDQLYIPYVPLIC